MCGEMETILTENINKLFENLLGFFIEGEAWV